MKRALIKIIIWIAILLGLAFLIVYGLLRYWSTPLSLIQDKNAPNINVILGEEVSSDFGYIQQGKGHFTRTYELFNSSNKPQIIVGARTNCGCTRVKIDDEFYGMIPRESPSLEILPNDSKTIEVYFDPDAHGPFSVGDIRRTIWLKANNEEKTVINFSATVTKEGAVIEEPEQTVVPTPDVKVEVEPVSHDFGEIVQSEGPVSTTFTVKNSGTKPLVINRLSTSCGCTTAEINKDPLQPGESREMTVVFDPMVHPDQLGEIERVVYLQTTDPDRPEVEIDIMGNVIK
jgi:hypothetical protein